MNHPLSHAAAIWILGALAAGVAEGSPLQTQLEPRPTPQPVPSALRDAGTYHVASGTWTRSGHTYGLPSVDTLFRNDIQSSYYRAGYTGDSVTDEGRLPGAGVPLQQGGPWVGTSDQYTIRGLRMAYCAITPQGVDARIDFIDQYAPCTNPAGYPVTASLDLTGLPGAGCWLVAFDFQGSSLAFDLVAEGGDGFDDDADLDDFGFRMTFTTGSPGPHVGPILAGSGSPIDEGSGTKFKNPDSAGSGLGLSLVSKVVADHGGVIECFRKNDRTFFRILLPVLNEKNRRALDARRENGR